MPSAKDDYYQPDDKGHCEKRHPQKSAERLEEHD
jgi:hypothetical protein